MKHTAKTLTEWLSEADHPCLLSPVQAPPGLGLPSDVLQQLQQYCSMVPACQIMLLTEQLDDQTAQLTEVTQQLAEREEQVTQQQPQLKSAQQQLEGGQRQTVSLSSELNATQQQNQELRRLLAQHGEQRCCS